MDAELIDPTRDRVWAVAVTVTFTTYVVAESASEAERIAEDEGEDPEPNYAARELTEPLPDDDRIVPCGPSRWEERELTVNEAVELVARHKPVYDTETVLMPFADTPPPIHPRRDEGEPAAGGARAATQPTTALERRSPMTPDERAGLIARLDAYNDQLAEAATQLDYGSLDRAADLAALYADRAWVEELEPVAVVDAKGRPRGRPVDPASRTRFNQWLREKRGWKLVATTSGRLLRAHEWMGNFDASGIGNRLTGEGAVRPLYRLQRLGFGDRTTEVMARALDLAGPAVVTSEHTRQAVRDFLAEQPKQPKATLRRRKVESECEAAFDKLMEDVWAITVHGPEGRPYLERVMTFVNRQLQEIPAEGGNAGVRVKAS